MQNQLMVFSKEMFKVKVKEINGELLFDAESAAKSLGLTTVAKSGNACVRWSRVNEYLKSPTKLTTGSFIPEAAVYKLAFKANNDVAEKFQDWLAIEVLPSIRKTGKYETNPRQLPQPRPKYFNGEPVITIRDLAEATGIDASIIRYHLKNCRAGIHYHVLTGSELADFKAENDEASSMNHLTVITKKGFVRLAKLIGRMPNKMECFQVEKHKEALPEAKHISGKADRLINEVHCCFDAAGVIMAIMRHHPSDIDAFRKVIEYVITSALVKALEI